MHKKRTLTLSLVLVIFICLLIGDLLLWLFLDYSRVSPPRLPANQHHELDAIAVLAGGSGRIQQGFNLFQQDKARYLLIIGTNPHSRSQDILTAFSRPGNKLKSPRTNRIIIENQSHNTLTNILALRNLCRLHQFHSLVIVTSPFHITRAYHLCQKILPPQIEVYYQPIQPQNKPGNNTVKPVPTFLQIKEFIKYLNALLRLPGKT